MHPFLAPDFLPRWSTLLPEHVEPDITQALAEAQKRIDAIAALDPELGELTYASTLGALEEATEGLSRAWGRVQHLDSVCDSPALRQAQNLMLPKVSEFYSRIPLNPQLWEVLRSFASTPEAQNLAPTFRRHLEETLADFQESGADLPPEKKARFQALEAELAQATKKFSENVLDATNAWELLIDDPSKLSGLSATAREAAQHNAREKGHGSDDAPQWRFTLHAPSFLPFMEQLEDESLRKEMWQASTAIGRGGEHDNTALIHQILRLRQEKAALLDKEHFPDLVLGRRMAKNGATALRFVEELHQRLAGKFQEQVQELQSYRARRTGVDRSVLLEPWEMAYWAEQQRRELYSFDEEALRPYFPIEGVLRGLFELAEILFGVTIVEDPEAGEVWHPEVKLYHLDDRESGERLGTFYADWHPRETKRGGAWMNYLETGLPPMDSQPRQPHLGLICGNMTAPTPGKPALLTHDEVQTVFHEFGHLLHHLLGEVEVKSLNGVNVAWDFVELPSQLMENFCWARESLDLFARHHETGQPIPDELYHKMIAARNYQSAMSFMRQLAFSKLDLELHLRAKEWAERDLDQVADEILEGYLVPTATHVPTMARRFTHLFASPTGYAAGYYSYKWAEVLDADAFTKFKENGVLKGETGTTFRETIFANGNSQPAEELFFNFMGRETEPDALLRRSGLDARG
ncbi:MAG: M3 family metallopeptidase [Verrucomicrobiota bacterium]